MGIFCTCVSTRCFHENNGIFAMQQVPRKRRPRWHPRLEIMADRNRGTVLKQLKLNAKMVLSDVVQKWKCFTNSNLLIYIPISVSAITKDLTCAEIYRIWIKLLTLCTVKILLSIERNLITKLKTFEGLAWRLEIFTTYPVWNLWINKRDVCYIVGYGGLKYHFFCQIVWQDPIFVVSFE